MYFPRTLKAMLAAITLVFAAGWLVLDITEANAQGPRPWGPDFEKEGILLGTAVCDSGKAAFRTYEDPKKDKDNGVGSYLGMTISIDGVVRYYMFVPNPDSMSPVVLLFRKLNEGGFESISSKALDDRLVQEAPNLYAFSYERDSDCRKQ